VTRVLSNELASLSALIVHFQKLSPSYDLERQGWFDYLFGLFWIK
jgi:hypothetical protein